MTYYRVKKEFDNYPKYVYIGKSLKMKREGILIGEELYTPMERQKIANADKFFDEIELPRQKTYWFFGARFADTEVYGQ